MPGFDRTGPLGTGPIGRGLGPCGGGRAFGRGGRFGFGGVGAGWRWNNWAPQTPEEETAALEQEKKWLESQLAAIKQRLERSE